MNRGSQLEGAPRLNLKRDQEKGATPSRRAQAPCSQCGRVRLGIKILQVQVLLVWYSAMPLAVRYLASSVRLHEALVELPVPVSHLRNDGADLSS